MGEADTLLLLAHRQPLKVRGKLYECLGMRRPMLATTRTLDRVNGQGGIAARALRDMADPTTGGHRPDGPAGGPRCRLSARRWKPTVSARRC
jgi:hypothetical protein